MAFGWILALPHLQADQTGNATYPGKKERLFLKSVGLWDIKSVNTQQRILANQRRSHKFQRVPRTDNIWQSLGYNFTKSLYQQHRCTPRI